LRITRLEIAGFRGFANLQQVDVDADAVIVVGANGRGKTSLFDAILRALSGNVPRLGETDENIVSKYSSSGEAHVTMHLRSENGSLIRLLRSYDGAKQRLRLDIDGRVLQEDAARLRLVEEIWPEALLTSDSGAAMKAALTRSVYLQQDLVRQFIDADTDETRFGAVSELVGTGRLTELQLQLERARAAWVKATNVRASDIESLRSRLMSLDGRLTEMSGDKEDTGFRVRQNWDQWWKEVRDAGLEVPLVPAAESIEASQALNIVVRQLESHRRAADRQRDTASELLRETQRRPETSTQDPTEVRKTFQAAERELGALRQALEAAEVQAAAERRALVEGREAREELRALAQLALRHLDERCPVCEQTYDKPKTRRRLEELAKTAGDPGSVDVAPTLSRLAALVLGVEQQERSRAAAAAQLARVEETAKEQRLWLAERDRRLTDLGIGHDDQGKIAADLEQLVRNFDATASRLATLQQRGEALALTLAQAGTRARKDELGRETEAVRRSVTAGENDLRARRETADQAAQIVQSLREGASDVVTDRLQQIGPLLQRIYARIDPHPAFRAVKLLVKMVRGRGRLGTVIDDALMDVSSDSPSMIFSSSQMNALAVSVFLAFNLGIGRLPLDVVILDDPLQSLDDVNLLGLIDLLRRTKDRRQLFVSTHDVRFARLLERKLRPVGPDQHSLVIELGGWDRQGPSVSQRSLQTDIAPFRIVA